MAWLAWLVVHIYFLIGFRNRLGVFRQWAWTYLTLQDGARLEAARPRHALHLEARQAVRGRDHGRLYRQ